MTHPALTELLSARQGSEEDCHLSFCHECWRKREDALSSPAATSEPRAAVPSGVGVSLTSSAWLER